MKSRLPFAPAVMLAVAVVVHGTIGPCSAQTATTEIKVSANGGSPQRNRELLENAIKLANDSLPVVRPIVIPAIRGGFIVDRPVLAFGPDLDIRGANPGTILSCRWQAPPLVLGLAETPSADADSIPKPNKWTGDHVVSSKLDSSLPGWSALKTFAKDGTPDTVYSFPSSPFNAPFARSWSEVPAFTLDVAYEDFGTPNGYPILGLGEGGKACPFYLQTTNWLPTPSHCLVFMTEDGTRRSFTFPISERTGLRRLRVEVNLRTATVSAESDGKPVPTGNIGLGEDFKPGNSLRFMDAGLACLKLGGRALGIAQFQDNEGGPTKYVFHGMRVGVPTGRPPANDAERYGLADSRTLIGYLDLADATIKTSRFVRWVASKPESSGGFGLALLANWHTHPNNTGTRVRLSDLVLQSGSPETYPFGDGVMAGGSIGGGFRFERCAFRGGMNGFGGQIAGACYPVLFRDCSFRGWAGDGLRLHFATARFEGQNEVSYPARNGMVFVRSNADISGLFMSEAGKDCLTNVSMLKGGRLTLSDFMFDTEYTAAPTLAVIFAERSVSGDFPMTRLSLSDGTIDGGAKGVPLIKLSGVSAEAKFRAELEMRGVNSWHPERGSTVATDSESWTGSITGYNVKPTRVHVSKFGKAGAISGVE